MGRSTGHGVGIGWQAQKVVLTKVVLVKVSEFRISNQQDARRKEPISEQWFSNRSKIIFR